MHSTETTDRPEHPLEALAEWEADAARFALGLEELDRHTKAGRDADAVTPEDLVWIAAMRSTLGTLVAVSRLSVEFHAKPPKPSFLRDVGDVVRLGFRALAEMRREDLVDEALAAPAREALLAYQKAAEPAWEAATNLDHEARTNGIPANPDIGLCRAWLDFCRFYSGQVVLAFEAVLHAGRERDLRRERTEAVMPDEDLAAKRGLWKRDRLAALDRLPALGVEARAAIDGPIEREEKAWQSALSAGTVERLKGQTYSPRREEEAKQATGAALRGGPSLVTLTADEVAAIRRLFDAAGQDDLFEGQSLGRQAEQGRRCLSSLEAAASPTEFEKWSKNVREKVVIIQDVARRELERARPAAPQAPVPRAPSDKPMAPGPEPAAPKVDEVFHNKVMVLGRVVRAFLGGLADSTLREYRKTDGFPKAEPRGNANMFDLIAVARWAHDTGRAMFPDRLKSEDRAALHDALAASPQTRAVGVKPSHAAAAGLSMAQKGRTTQRTK